MEIGIAIFTILIIIGLLEGAWRLNFLIKKVRYRKYPMVFTVRYFKKKDVVRLPDDSECIVVASHGDYIWVKKIV